MAKTATKPAETWSPIATSAPAATGAPMASLMSYAPLAEATKKKTELEARSRELRTQLAGMTRTTSDEDRVAKLLATGEVDLSYIDPAGVAQVQGELRIVAQAVGKLEAEIQSKHAPAAGRAMRTSYLAARKKALAAMAASVRVLLADWEEAERVIEECEAKLSASIYSGGITATPFKSSAIAVFGHHPDEVRECFEQWLREHDEDGFTWKAD